jgi:hypothetical protein
MRIDTFDVSVWAKPDHDVTAIATEIAAAATARLITTCYFCTPNVNTVCEEYACPGCRIVDGKL